MRYVERNPVRANFIELAEDWQWSSAYVRFQRADERLLDGNSYCPVDATDLPAQCLPTTLWATLKRLLQLNTLCISVCHSPNLNLFSEIVANKRSVQTAW